MSKRVKERENTELRGYGDEERRRKEVNEGTGVGRIEEKAAKGRTNKGEESGDGGAREQDFEGMGMKEEGIEVNERVEEGESKRPTRGGSKRCEGRKG